MWRVILQSLKPGAKQVAVVEGIFIFVVCVYAWNQHERISLQKKDLETAQYSLAHPKTVEVVRVVKVSGPVRIVTKIVERPSGEKETTTDSTTFGSQEAWGTEKASEPVTVSAIISQPPVRTDRFLLGFSNRNLSLGRLSSCGLWSGYSWKNRIDLLAGVTYGDRVDGNLLALLRF